MPVTFHALEAQTENTNSAQSLQQLTDCKGIISKDSLSLSFEFDIKGTAVSSDEALHIVPVYIENGKTVKRFPAILINGRARNAYYKREQGLQSHDKWLMDKPYTVVSLRKKDSQTIVYHYALPNDQAVNTHTKGAFYLEQYIQDCCNLRYLGQQLLAEPKYKYEGKRMADAACVTFINPGEGGMRVRTVEKPVRISYVCDKDDVRINFADNEKELSELQKFMQDLSANKNLYNIQKVVVKGYASPEGTAKHNMLLSERRAKGFMNYFADKYQVKELSMVALGADWKGLEEAVKEDAYVPARDKVLEILQIENADKRFHALQNVDGGKAYRYLLDYIYPRLRRVVMEISYSEVLGINEVRRLHGHNPKALSLSEWFELAQMNNARNEDHDCYGAEYIDAAAYFPNNAIANINAASAAMVRGNLKMAESYLSKVGDDARAYNNWGMYYWMQGDAQQAQSYFEKAIAANQSKEQAEANLQLLKNE